MQRKVFKQKIADLNSHIARLIELSNSLQADPGLAYESNLDEHDNTPAHLAAAFGGLFLLKEMHAMGAPINTANNKGWRPIHYAAKNGQCAVLRFLVSAGIPVDTLTGSDSTSLHHAIKNGKIDSCVTLLELGADKTLRNSAYRILPLQYGEKELTPEEVAEYVKGPIHAQQGYNFSDLLKFYIDDFNDLQKERADEMRQKLYKLFPTLFADMEKEEAKELIVSAQTPLNRNLKRVSYATREIGLPPFSEANSVSYATREIGLPPFSEANKYTTRSLLFSPGAVSCSGSNLDGASSLKRRRS